MSRRAYGKDKPFLGFQEKKKKRVKESVLTLSLARNVKNLGNSLCVKRRRKWISPSQLWLFADKHIVQKQSSIYKTVSQKTCSLPKLSPGSINDPLDNHDFYPISKFENHHTSNLTSLAILSWGVGGGGVKSVFFHLPSEKEIFVVLLLAQSGK